MAPSPNELSRRDFLKVAGLFGAGTVLAACGLPGQTEPPTKPAEFTPTPVAPQEVEFQERILQKEAQLVIETYKISGFTDITSEIPEEYRHDIETSFSQPEDSRRQSYKWGEDHWLILREQSDRFLFSQGEIRPNIGMEYILLDRSTGRYYADIVPPVGLSNQVEQTDQKILQWDYVAAVSKIMMTSDGKIIYSVTNTTLASEETKEAVIVVDFPEKKKTAIRNTYDQMFDVTPARNGERIFLSYPQTLYHLAQKDRIPPNQWMSSSFLLDLNTWRPITRLEDWSTSLNTLINYEGTVLYITPNYEWENSFSGYYYDVPTGKKTAVHWPGNLTPYYFHGSDDLRFIARRLGMSWSMETVEGQWGIEVLAPDGYFYQINAHGWSLQPQRIDNDGTVYTFRGDVFKFENGTYVLVKNNSGKELDYHVNRQGSPVP